jgi:hypothetical protein
MRISRAKVLVAVALGTLVGSGLCAFADEGPLAELERALHSLEDTVRAIHQERLEAKSEAERGRAAAAELDADARDLEREATALEDEIQPLRAQIAAAERDRDAARARASRLAADRDALEKVLASGDRGTAPPGVALAERARALEARREQARSCSVEPDGSVRVGIVGRIAAGSPAARAVADQLSRSAPPSLVRSPIELDRGGSK